MSNEALSLRPWLYRRLVRHMMSDPWSQGGSEARDRVLVLHPQGTGPLSPSCRRYGWRPQPSGLRPRPRWISWGDDPDSDDDTKAEESDCATPPHLCWTILWSGTPADVHNEDRDGDPGAPSHSVF